MKFKGNKIEYFFLLYGCDLLGWGLIKLRLLLVKMGFNFNLDGCFWLFSRWIILFFG